MTSFDQLIAGFAIAKIDREPFCIFPSGEPHLEIEFYRPQFNVFLLLAGPGFLGQFYPITCTYGNPLDNGLLPTVTDAMPNSKLVAVDNTNSEGIDAAAVKLTFMPLNLYYNGIPAILNGLPAIGAIA